MDFSLKLDYEGEEDKPIQAKIDIPLSGAKKQDLLITEDTGAVAEQPSSIPLDIYSDKDVVFVPPMYIICTA